MVHNIAENNIRKGIDDLGDRHYDTDRAYGHADFIRVKIGHLADQVGHDAQRELTAHVRQIVLCAHGEPYSLGIKFLFCFSHF